MAESKQTQNRIEFFDPEQLVAFSQDESAELSNETPEYPSEEEQVIVLDDDYYASEIEKTKILKKREDFRGTLALVYTVSTFLLFLIGMAIAVVDGMNRDVSIIENLERILPLLSGIFLGTLGFVLGYYFRKSDE